MKDKSLEIGVLVVVFVLGTIVPFVDYLVVIQAFYLLIPLNIFFIGSFVLLIASLFSRAMNSRLTLFITCIVPIFFGTQIISTYTVDKIRRHKAELLIEEIESVATTDGLPTSYETSFGIEFQKLDGLGNYRIRYSRGFMVTEVYDSNLKSWKGYDWND